MSDGEDEIAVYDEVEIEDMTFDEAVQIYHYPCPCGDRFEIALADLQDESNDIAVCPSCSLMIRVIFDKVRIALWVSHCRPRANHDPLQDDLPKPDPDPPALEQVPVAA